ncbi:carbohydrate ABC transporter permease [Vallicoccus soli]|uniref:Sugar ABC transporter permease n=1 Tax=Vallicoccus soli TaxID=2339232 RepID=A0A3A3YXF6_9ACTN|nr:sugar ABC transporter permease [Vallicoccus soli]RJK95465.1 sugar ABC transporter permease [Vallicoccus soli]
MGILGLFLLLPILMALWVSLTSWDGQGSPFTGDVGFVGLDNYSRLFLQDGLVRRDFMTSLRNNAWYVLLVVPLQTVFALALALLLNQRLRGRGFFRTAFYFPSVTSSVAISLVFLFLFTGSGTVNALLGLVGVDGPTWFADPRGTVHLLGDALGLWDAGSPPSWLAGTTVGGLSLWEWVAGPSVALCAIIALVVWTTTGTFMLMFLAALQDLPHDVTEAALVDGTNRWQRFRHVVLPQLRPTLFLVLTLGLIGTWQVFDQVYVMSQGNPAKTTLTPAFLSYLYSFRQNEWGLGAAMAFVLFVIIIVLTALQRFVMRDRDDVRERRELRAQRRAGRRTQGAAR